MNRLPSNFHRAVWSLLCIVLLPGCFSAFSQRSAHEVSRDKLLQISEKGTTDHLQYVGSDFQYHYVYDSRPGKERSYKISVREVNLKDTFPVGEDSYVLHPWVIEGTPFGTKTDDDQEEMRKSAKKTKPYLSDMSGTPQAVVKGPAEADIGEEVGDDQIEPGRVETP